MNENKCKSPQCVKYCFHNLDALKTKKLTLDRKEIWNGFLSVDDYSKKVFLFNVFYYHFEQVTDLEYKIIRTITRINDGEFDNDLQTQMEILIFALAQLAQNHISFLEATVEMLKLENVIDLTNIKSHKNSLDMLSYEAKEISRIAE